MWLFSYLEAVAYYDGDRTAWTEFTDWLSEALQGASLAYSRSRDKWHSPCMARPGASEETTPSLRAPAIRNRAGSSAQLAPS